MYEVKALASFDHHGNRRVGDQFNVGSKRQAEELAEKGLVEVVGELAGQETMEKSAAEKLVEGTASDVIASLTGNQDKDLLQALLAAERAGKNRKTVIDALESAVKAG